MHIHNTFTRFLGMVAIQTTRTSALSVSATIRLPAPLSLLIAASYPR